MAKGIVPCKISWMNAEACIEFCQALIMECFCENDYWFLAVNCFWKKTPSQMFDRILKDASEEQIFYSPSKSCLNGSLSKS